MKNRVYPSDLGSSLMFAIDCLQQESMFDRGVPRILGLSRSRGLGVSVANLDLVADADSIGPTS